MLHVWHRNQEIDRKLAEARREDGLPGYQEGGYDPPSRSELSGIPWAGAGRDPLEDELQAMIEDEGP